MEGPKENLTGSKGGSSCVILPTELARPVAGLVSYPVFWGSEYGFPLQQTQRCSCGLRKEQALAAKKAEKERIEADARHAASGWAVWPMAGTTQTKQKEKPTKTKPPQKTQAKPLKKQSTKTGRKQHKTRCFEFFFSPRRSGRIGTCSMR